MCMCACACACVHMCACVCACACACVCVCVCICVCICVCVCVCEGVYMCVIEMAMLLTDVCLPRLWCLTRHKARTYMPRSPNLYINRAGYKHVCNHVCRQPRVQAKRGVVTPVTQGEFRTHRTHGATTQLWPANRIRD